MSKQETADIHKKLDKIIYFMGTTEEHFKTLNGSVRRHEEKLVECEQRFTKVYEDFQKSQKVCSVSTSARIEDVHRLALDNKGNILKFQGVSIGFSVLATVIGILGGSKALGLW
jgi:thymidylate kinase